MPYPSIIALRFLIRTNLVSSRAGKEDDSGPIQGRPWLYLVMWRKDEFIVASSMHALCFR